MEMSVSGMVPISEAKTCQLHALFFQLVVADSESVSACLSS